MCGFNLRPVSTGNMLVFTLKLFIKVEYRAVIYLFEVNNANTRNVWNLFYINNNNTPCSDVFIVDFEQISHLCFFHCSLWTIQFRPSVTTISNHPKLLKRIKFLIKIRKILNKTPMLRHVFLVFGNQWFYVSIKGVIACEMLSRFRKRLVIWCGLPHLTL